jgi:hypothetical protein
LDRQTGLAPLEWPAVLALSASPPPGFGDGDENGDDVTQSTAMVILNSRIGRCPGTEIPSCEELQVFPNDFI